MYYNANIKENIKNPVSQAQHNWMANHINDMADVLKEFVETNYITTATFVKKEVPNVLDAYKAYIYNIDKDLAKSNIGELALPAILQANGGKTLGSIASNLDYGGTTSCGN